jgi:hypothetical protein
VRPPNSDDLPERKGEAETPPPKEAVRPTFPANGGSVAAPTDRGAFSIAE